jgi:hypothetical protein
VQAVDRTVVVDGGVAGHDDLPVGVDGGCLGHLGTAAVDCAQAESAEVAVD